MSASRTGPRICLCGTTQNVELHHVGGRNHVVWFLVPLCREHHLQLTVMLQRGGVDMRYTPDRAERMRRARLATYVFLWFIDAVLLEQSTKG
jgi:hypothetical protein